MLVIGIDVGKEELVACLQHSLAGEPPGVIGSLQTVANTLAGHNKLVRWLAKQLQAQDLAQDLAPDLALSQVHVVLEATNVYWEACAYHFYALGCHVSVMNPAQIKFFARSTLRRGKTDAMDAEIIARFGLMMRPAPWTPPAPGLLAVKQLVREREAMLTELGRERNRLQALQRAQYTSPVLVRLASLGAPRQTADALIGKADAAA